MKVPLTGDRVPLSYARRLATWRSRAAWLWSTSVADAQLLLSDGSRALGWHRPRARCPSAWRLFRKWWGVGVRRAVVALAAEVWIPSSAWAAIPQRDPDRHR
jgi:hypothetical protein